MGSSHIRGIGSSSNEQLNAALLRQFDGLMVTFMYVRKSNLGSYLYTLKASRRPVLERHLRESGAPEAISIVFGGTRSVDVFILARVKQKLSGRLTRIADIFVSLDGELFMKTYIIGPRGRDVGMRAFTVTKEELLQDHYLESIIDTLIEANRA